MRCGVVFDGDGDDGGSCDLYDAACQAVIMVVPGVSKQF
jgi:hypothetical protein